MAKYAMSKISGSFNTKNNRVENTQLDIRTDSYLLYWTDTNSGPVRID